MQKWAAVLPFKQPRVASAVRKIKDAAPASTIGDHWQDSNRSQRQQNWLKVDFSHKLIDSKF
jgi:hypothetical protein